ncbi:hypothetical protein PR202_gb18055 [Eleusine coracana subsp. coracana]|uniref:Uncharacterized protein n=1 Tax=Eleusine coracana subsp. coracana TaxID=191504 RepID=A0AAV5F600_ELECO|nr:hypothetical protein PR202_gb17988 [Eleusine coracana subsp. coracana]GJN29800.1 hypothetical protein PR202_gb18055 [Eleusine coracana subsp. coracana]
MEAAARGGSLASRHRRACVRSRFLASPSALRRLQSPRRTEGDFASLSQHYSWRTAWQFQLTSPPALHFTFRTHIVVSCRRAPWMRPTNRRRRRVLHIAAIRGVRTVAAMEAAAPRAVDVARSLFVFPLRRVSGFFSFPSPRAMSQALRRGGIGAR